MHTYYYNINTVVARLRNAAAAAFQLTTSCDNRLHSSGWCCRAVVRVEVCSSDVTIIYYDIVILYFNIAPYTVGCIGAVCVDEHMVTHGRAVVPRYNIIVIALLYRSRLLHRLARSAYITTIIINTLAHTSVDRRTLARSRGAAEARIVINVLLLLCYITLLLLLLLLLYSSKRKRCEYLR